MIFWGLFGSVLKIAAIAVIVLSSISIAAAESIFLKDGSIVEGKVTAESDKEITVETANKMKVQIPRHLVLRKTGSADYKTRVFIYTRGGAEISGHIVFDDAGAYYVRPDLAKPDEIRVAKGEVSEILKTRRAGDAAAGKTKIYTPKYAAQVSLIPLKSGSLLVGTDWLGVSFCFLKSGSLLVPLSLLFASVSIGPSYESDGSDSSSNNYLLQDEKFRTIALISLGAWALFTAADAVYSYQRVKKYNEKKGISRNGEGEVFFSINPLMPAVRPGYGATVFVPEGVSLSATLRF